MAKKEKKLNAKQAAYVKKQEEKGNKVVAWIIYHILTPMSGMEIERKFLVRDSSYRQAARSSSHIQQGYLSSGRGCTVRVRLRDDEAYLTIKGPSADGGLSRYEFEKTISRDEGEHLL